MRGKRIIFLARRFAPCEKIRMTTLAQHISEAGKTQREFAADAGISPSYLCEILAGAKKPGLDLAVKIERITGGRVTAVSWVEGAAGQ